MLRTDKDASPTVAVAGGVQRLLGEARSAAALNHANSVAIYELGEAEGIAYIAMELITGVTLRRYMAPEQLEGSPPDALADQFAFGITAYELISGVYPGGPLAGFPRLDAAVRGVSEELALVVGRMM